MVPLSPLTRYPSDRSSSSSSCLGTSAAPAQHGPRVPSRFVIRDARVTPVRGHIVPCCGMRHGGNATSAEGIWPHIAAAARRPAARRLTPRSLRLLRGWMPAPRGGRHARNRTGSHARPLRLRGEQGRRCQGEIRTARALAGRAGSMGPLHGLRPPHGMSVAASPGRHAPNRRGAHARSPGLRGKFRRRAPRAIRAFSWRSFHGAHGHHSEIVAPQVEGLASTVLA